MAKIRDEAGGRWRRELKDWKGGGRLSFFPWVKLRRHETGLVGENLIPSIGGND